MRSVVLQPRTHTTASPTAKASRSGSAELQVRGAEEEDIGDGGSYNVLHSTVGGQRCHTTRSGTTHAQDDAMTLLPEPASSFTTVRDRLAAVDPGGFAARTALRASVALAASALLLLAFGRPYGDPILLAIVGGEVAMLTSASVSDPGLAEQRVTLLLCLAASA